MKQTFDNTQITVLIRFILSAGIIAFAFIAGCQSMPPPKPYQAPSGVIQKSGSPYVFLSATEMATAIRDKKITSQELVQMHLNHIYLHNPELNAIILLDDKAALKRATQADEALARGEIWGPLHGVPITIKDHFAIKNMVTTNAHPDTAEQITLFDATVVARMKEAGAIILGKTNLPFVSMDLQTSNVIFGKTSNPWNTDYTPGGSTGGGAAAVSSGMSPIDIGSDIGGSLRIPAHFTGTYSFKPTENVVSSHGSFPGLFSQDSRSVRNMSSIGPITRSVEDLKLAFDIILGPDQKDPLVMPIAKYSNDGEKTIGTLRIAWSEEFGDIPVTDDTRKILIGVINKLSNAGSDTVEVAPDIGFPETWETWGEMIDIQIMSRQAGHLRFVSFLMGWSYRARTPLLQMVYPLSTDKYVQVLSRRDLLVTGFERFMSEWDVFICPVATRSAIEHYPPDAIRSNLPIYTRPVQVNGHKLNYFTALGAYATPFNVTGNPVVTIPVGYATNGMPIGLQLVGKRWQDYELLEIARIIDDVVGGYRPPDGY